MRRMVKLTWYFGCCSWPALLALASLGCTAAKPNPRQPSPGIRSPVLTQDCLDWAHAQEPLADLALKTMQTFGRIDPGFYRRSPEGMIGRDAEARPLPSVSPEPFDAALARVNEIPAARDGLTHGLAAAESLCRESACPAVVYPIIVASVETHIPDDHLFTWELSGQVVPEAVQWRAFLLTHASGPAFCPVPGSITVRSRLSGLAQTSGLFNHASGETAEASARSGHGHDDNASFGCFCPYMGSNQRSGRPCTSCPGYFSAQPCDDR
jgi:hypothetical protein